MITVFIAIALFVSIIANVLLTMFCKRLLDTNSRLMSENKEGGTPDVER